MILSPKRFGFIAWLLIPALLGYLTQDFSYALNQGSTGQKQSVDSSLTGADSEIRFDDLLIELKNALQPAIGTASQQDASGRTAIDLSLVRGIRANLVRQDQQVRAYFEKQKSFLASRGLSGELTKRLEEMAQAYDANWKSLSTHLGRIDPAVTSPFGLLSRALGRDPAGQAEAARNLDSFLQQRLHRPRGSRLDPANLPHRTLKAANPVLPKLTQEEWLKAFPKEATKNKTSSLSTSSPDLIRSGSSSTDATAMDAPILSGPVPDSNDLAETIDVKLTPEIRQKAADLGKNPVKIYNWVRNNIYFVPIWGSIQGAQLCYETRVCNAFDTSSLLIALLRASDIPARYQMGTIEVPIEAFKNWAGGFTDADAAASFFASAGVPSVVRRVDGTGQVTSVKLEHVWVKAFVDYAPSGGALNRSGDTWVDLDPSYKQYQFVNRTDYRSILPDMNNVIQQMLSGASIDTESGFVARLNGAAIESNMEAMAVQLRQSLDGLTASQKGAMLIGTKAIRNANPEVLPPITPYRVLSSGIGFSTLPDNLRHSLVITLEDQTGVTMLSWKAFLPELGGKRLALKFTAATEVDETAIVALAEEQIGVFTVPSSVHVKPVLTLNGETLIAGSPVGFGAKNQLSYGFRAPTISTPDIANIINAGELFAIGLDLSSISSKQLSDKSTYFQNIMSLVASGQYDAVGDGNLAERMLQAIIWGWFSQSDVSSFALSRSVDAETIRYPSAGLCFLELKSNTLFGIALSASMSGLSLDIDRDVVVTTSKDGDDTKVKFLSRAQGTIGSSLEGEMPTHFFAGSNQKPIWGSTISLLDRANELGVALISINSNNLDSILPQLSLPQTVKDEIGDAVNAGMKVLAPQSEVTQLRFTGLGYIVEDPVSG